MERKKRMEEGRVGREWEEQRKSQQWHQSTLLHEQECKIIYIWSSGFCQCYF